MNEKATFLQEKIQRLEEKIQETKNRLPAHSVKPPIMMELLDLEDTHIELSRQLQMLLRDSAKKEQ